MTQFAWLLGVLSGIYLGFEWGRLYQRNQFDVQQNLH